MKRLASIFHWLRDLIQVLVVCRVSVMILALGFFFLIAVPQGQEVLQAIGESHQDRVIDVKAWLFVAVLFWAASIWYWARILLAVAAPDIRADTPNLRLLRRHLPRWLGTGAILAIAGGLLHAAQAFQIAISRQYTTGENEPSGATAASELWAAIRRWTQASGDWTTIRPILLIISNDPINPIQAHHAYKTFMAKTLAPIVAMSQARLARDQYALTALANQVRQHGGSVISVGLINRGVPIPLGWMLSDSSKGEIDDQLHHYFQAPARQSAVAQIDALLGKAAR